MKTVITSFKYLLFNLLIVVLCVACGETENQTMDNYNPFENESDQYTLIYELKSSNMYLNESNNIKVYGNGEDSLGNYTDIKFVYKGNELIIDDIKIFTGLDMTREDSRRFKLSIYEDIDLLSITYYEKVSADEIEENILFFDQQTFSLIEPEDINISISKEPVEDKLLIEDKLYNLYLAKAYKADPEIFDQKEVIAYNSRIEPCIEIFALKKNDDDNYTDIYISILGMNKIISLPECKQFIYLKPGSLVLDINSDGNNEVIIDFFEKTAGNEITERICFIDVNTGKEMDIYDLNLENIVDVTYEYDAYSQEFENESYKFNSCHYNRKEPVNEVNFNPEMLKILTYGSEGNICVSVLNDPISYITENGKPPVLILQKDDQVKFYYGWTMPEYSEISHYDTSVDIQLMDVNNDGVNEIVMSMHIGGGTGAVGVDLHIIDGNTLEETNYLNNWNVRMLLMDYIDSQIYIDDNDVEFDIWIKDILLDRYIDSVNFSEDITYFDALCFASIVYYNLDPNSNKIMAKVSATAGIDHFVGYLTFNIVISNNEIVFQDIQFVSY
jgi:uncharacterized protein YxeA